MVLRVVIKGTTGPFAAAPVAVVGSAALVPPAAPSPAPSDQLRVLNKHSRLSIRDTEGCLA